MYISKKPPAQSRYHTLPSKYATFPLPLQSFPPSTSFLIHFIQLYGGIINKILRCLKSITQRFDICVLREKISTNKFINICITSYIYPFCLFWEKALNFYSINTFQSYNIVLSTIVIMLNIRSSELHLITVSLYTLPISPYFLHL